MICSLPWPAGPVARPSPFPDRAKIPHGYITGQELAVFIHCPDRLLGFPPFNELQSSSSDWKLVATDHVPNVARLAALAYTCQSDLLLVPGYGLVATSISKLSEVILEMGA